MSTPGLDKRRKHEKAGICGTHTSAKHPVSCGLIRVEDVALLAPCVDVEPGAADAEGILCSRMLHM